MDSEDLCNQAFLDLLPELSDSVTSMVGRYRGMKLSAIIGDIERRIRRTLPSEFETKYRERVAELFECGLRPIAGAEAMLQVTSGPRCVASSGPRAKIEKALALTRLAVYFGDRIFSSYEIGSWKPEPQLFLHAAASMGFEPQQCVVIEDSEVGVQAALSAGMRVLRYAPHCEQDSVRPYRSFSKMADLSGLLWGLRNTGVAQHAVPADRGEKRRSR